MPFMQDLQQRRMRRHPDADAVAHGHGPGASARVMKIDFGQPWKEADPQNEPDAAEVSCNERGRQVRRPLTQHIGVA